MAAAGMENLGVLRITKIIQALQDQREKQPKKHRWLSRTTSVPAMNGELIARFVGRILIADLVAPDSAGAAYSSGKLNFEAYQLPKIKIGRTLTETQLEQWNQIRSGQIVGEEAVYDFLGPIVDNCLTGIENRKEALLVAMFRDRLDYDRLGYKATGITWGMPSDLKITVATSWTDAANATPIDNLLNAVLIGRVRYGIEFDRVTLSTQALRYMIATTEFINKAKPFIRADLGWSANYSAYSLGMQTEMFEQITGLKLEVADERYWYQNADGTLASARYQPINEVILDSSQNDRDTGVRDLAQGIVVESLFTGLNPAAIVGGMAGMNGPRRGPLGYMTFPPDLNPPNVTVWGVDCAFPRRHLLQQNAVLNVGTFVDTIPVGEPF